MKRSLFKRSNMGQVPGDMMSQAKARMLEEKTPFRYLGYIISTNCIKSFREEIKQKFKRRFRRKGKQECRSETMEE